LRGVLLDTHTLYWLVSGAAELEAEALVAIGESQQVGKLYVSPITAWEISLATQKQTNAPQLGELTGAKWFRAAIRETGARIIPIGERIAAGAADVVAETRHKDPGDCYLIATARMKKIPIVTRDATIIQIADSGYLDVIAC